MKCDIAAFLLYGVDVCGTRKLYELQRNPALSQTSRLSERDLADGAKALELGRKLSIPGYLGLAAASAATANPVGAAAACFFVYKAGQTALELVSDSCFYASGATADMKAQRPTYGAMRSALAIVQARCEGSWGSRRSPQFARA